MREDTIALKCPECSEPFWLKVESQPGYDAHYYEASQMSLPQKLKALGKHVVCPNSKCHAKLVTSTDSNWNFVVVPHPGGFFYG